jgi:hypothetical protein
MTWLEFAAVVDALHQWMDGSEDVVGHATDDDGTEALCRARMVDGVFTVEQPVLL